LGNVYLGNNELSLQEYEKIYLGSQEIWSSLSFPVSNLIAYYKFDGDGDDSFGSNDLTEVVNTSPVYTTGKIGNSFVCSGNGSNGDYLTKTSGIPNLNDFTATFWIYPTTYDSANYIFSLGYRTQGVVNSFLYFYSAGNGGMRLLFNNSSGNTGHQSSGTLATPPLNAWTFVAIRRDGSTIKLRHNDTDVTLDVTTCITDTMDSGRIDYGRAPGRGTSLNPFKGRIDESGLWSKALSDSELDDLYNSGSGLTYS
jgi:hypothetical protein